MHGVTGVPVLDLDPDGGVTHVYTPRGSARRVFECRDPELLVSGPAGTGKSRACLEKLLIVALMNPKFRGLIARKTGVSLTATTLQTWKEHVAKEALGAGLCVYYGGSKSEPAQYRFTNGARIMITGLDKPEKIMSSEFDIIYVGEATELVPKDWEFLSARLRNGGISFQQLLADCNPDRPTHWIKSRADEGTTTMLYSQHWENPRYYEEVQPGTPGVLEEHEGKLYRLTPQGVDYLGRLDALTGVRKDRLRHGKWVAADGLVYSEWNPAIHLITKQQLGDKGRIPADWPRIHAVDFGFTNPFVYQWWCIDPDGRLILYREIYRTQRLVEDHAAKIAGYMFKHAPQLTSEQRKWCDANRGEAYAKGWLVAREPLPIRILADHDAEDRATLKKHLGIGTKAANKTVTRGIQAVESRLKLAGDGKPRLFVVSGCRIDMDKALKDAGKPTCTEDEFGSYVWPDSKPKRAEDEHPVKEHDHGMDTTRYVVADRDLKVRLRSDRDTWL